MDLKETDILGEELSAHWYYRSKARATLLMLKNHAPAKILDVGAGSGFFARYLLAHTGASEAWCVDTGYMDDWSTIDLGKPIHFQRSISTSSADLLLLMDVLEHVDDDMGLLREYSSKIPRNGNVLISVPAFQSLWSEHDEFLDHKRRYTLRGLERLVERSGLSVLCGAYFFGFVLPAAAASRLSTRFRPMPRNQRRSQLSRHSRLVNEALAHICDLELKLMRLNRLGGLTAFCLASIP